MGNAAGDTPYARMDRMAGPLRVCSFALGMVLWSLCAGRAHPWADAEGRLPGMGPLVLRVTRGERPDLAALHRDTTPQLRGLIERCWAGDPAARPTAQAIAREAAGWVPVSGVSCAALKGLLRGACGCART